MVTPPFPDHTGTEVWWTEEQEYRDPLDQNRVVMKTHWYLDKNEQPAGSGNPDPKFIRIGEDKYHLWSPGNAPCKECPPLDRAWMHLQNLWDWIVRLPPKIKDWTARKIKRMSKRRIMKP
jgi:hypothetical protein